MFRVLCEPEVTPGYPVVRVMMLAIHWLLVVPVAA